MDPVTAFSLAGPVLALINFGSHLIRLAVDIYNGNEKERELAKCIQTFRKTVDCLEVPSLCASSNEIDQLAAECKTFSDGLLVQFRKINIASASGSKSRRAAFRAALSSIIHEKEQQELTRQLNEFRERLSLQLLVSLRHFAAQTIFDQQRILEALQVSNIRNERLETNMEAILLHVTSQNSPEVSQSEEEDISERVLRHLMEDDRDSQSEHAAQIVLPENLETRLQDAMISALEYPGMNVRQETVADSFASTFDWALRTHESPQTWDNFAGWLQSEDQIYWISGKAGSGKSTLVKYLSHFDTDNSSRCLPFLNKWAVGNDLIIAPFYFWASDSGRQQKSRDGLLRTLLHIILLAKPSLIRAVFPSDWESLSLVGRYYKRSRWSEQVLLEGLIRGLKALERDSVKVCFYIDGLDEFDGEPSEAIELVQQIAAVGKHIKLCVASRPWGEFQEAFDSYPKLRLEDLTREDITLFVSTKLSKHPEFANLVLRQRDFAEQLVDKIVVKAAGVFLWVALVVTSLLAGLSAGDRVQDLEKALDEAPAGLKDLFERLLLGLSKHHQQSRAEMIMLVEAARISLPLTIFAFADELTVRSVESLQGTTMSENDLDAHKHAASLRLNSRWRGLLEVQSLRSTCDEKESDSLLSEGSSFQLVQYLHKTVRDFIQSSEQMSTLQSALPDEFDPHLQLCIAYCASMKIGRRSDSHKKCDPRVLEIFYHASKVSKRQSEVVRVIDQIPDSMLQERIPKPRAMSTVVIKATSWAEVRAAAAKARALSVTSDSSISTTTKPIGDPPPVDGKLLRSALSNSSTLTNSSHRRPSLLVESNYVIEERTVADRLVSLAARHGVVAYLTNKIGYNQDQQYYNEILCKIYGNSTAQVNTIHWLFERGADPNCGSIGHNGRPWPRLLYRCIGKSSLAELDGPTRDSVIAFVSHGADLKVIKTRKIRSGAVQHDQRWPDSLYMELKAIPLIRRNSRSRSFSKSISKFFVAPEKPQMTAMRNPDFYAFQDLEHEIAEIWE